MLSKSFVKKTKKGNVIKVVQEHYLRDDIACGSLLCKECSQERAVLSSSAERYIVIDTNVALRQIDLLENKSMTDVIILQTVNEEIKHQNPSVWGRLQTLLKDKQKRFFMFSNEHHRDTYVERQPGESMNDRNDRAIRAAAQWYIRHISESKPVLLVTNDMGNLHKALQENIIAKTVFDYVRGLSTHPELLDLLSGSDAVDESGEGVQSRKKSIFEEHKPMSEISSGVKAGRYFQGVFRFGREVGREGSIAAHLDGKDTRIFISGFESINRAMDGDVVAVQLLPREQWRVPSAAQPANGKPAAASSSSAASAPAAQAMGKVIGIVKRNWRQYCGSLDERSVSNIKSRGAGNVLFVAMDSKVPKIRIHTRQAEELANKRLIVAIDSWDKNSRFPTGHYVGTVGVIGDKTTETEVILMERDVPHYTFPEAVLKCLPPMDWTIPEEEIAVRMDLRHLDVCSVDPPGCKDIDDALHCRLLENGNYEVGVHIADVTHFLKEGTAMDDEAAKRSTSVYLVDRRIDMLPALLTENLCSLRGGEERLAFSNMWEMTPDAHILRTWFGKSVIKSRAAMTYAEAQTRIDDKNATDDLSQSLRGLMSIAKILRRTRFERGALELASPEVKFHLDSDSLNPTDVGMYELRDTNAMVEEFMLLANVSTAEEIYKHFPTNSLLRRHPSPNEHSFDFLLKACSAIGVSMDVKNSLTLARSLDNARRPDVPFFNTLLRILTTRCMQQALYFCTGDHAPDEFHHYGLAAPTYTHFTSPIRRYSDVIVHRLLSAALGISPLTEGLTSRERMRDLAANMNYRHKMAQDAGRDSVQLHTLLYFRAREAYEDAYIIRVKTNSLSVIVPRYGIEGMIQMDELSDDKATKEQGAFVLDEKDMSVALVRPPKGLDAETLQALQKRKIKIFDKVKVHIRVHQGAHHRQTVVVDIVDPPVQKVAALLQQAKGKGPKLAAFHLAPETEEQAEDIEAQEEVALEEDAVEAEEEQEVESEAAASSSIPQDLAAEKEAMIVADAEQESASLSEKRIRNQSAASSSSSISNDADADARSSKKAKKAVQ